MSKSIIDNATHHFKEVVSQNLKGPIDVPEWDAKIWYKPATTMAQESRVIQLAQDNKQTEALVVSLIQRACDQDGKPVFTMEHKARLMNAVDPKVILRVVTNMSDDESQAEEYLGN